MMILVVCLLGMRMSRVLRGSWLSEREAYMEPALTNVVNLIRNRSVGPIDQQGVVYCHMLAHIAG